MAPASARRSPRLAILLALVAIGAGALALLVPGSRGGAVRSDAPVLLFTSLPILWGEGAGIGDALNPDAPPHWALAVLREAGDVGALDALADAKGEPAIGPAGLLVMAQPRALSPAENVALDDWVRGGGRVLLFADPMLTAHSAYAIGDPRRAQDVAMLSPILRRWGLELTFDEDQPPGERSVPLAGGQAPVNLPGAFRTVEGATAACAIRDGGLLARCAVGKGTVLAIADAALFETGDKGETLRREALRRLIAAIRS